MARKKKETDSLEVKFELQSEYGVKFTRDMFGDENGILAELLGADGKAEPRVMLVADRAVVEKTPELGRKIGKYFKDHGIKLASRPFVVNGGEINKTNGMTTVRQVTEVAADAALGRDGFLVVMGGGALIDATCYAAAAFNRGLRTVRVPTTLLAQCSGACYPFVGTNILNRKDANSIFAPPYASIVDFDFLKSLPEGQRREGVSEAVKIAAAADAKFLAWIGKNAEKIAAGDEEAIEETIRRSAALHASVISKEMGRPGFYAERIFEFGHWSAHRIEALGRFRIPHAAALAVGLCIDAAYAVAKKTVSEEDADIVGETLAKCGALNDIEKIAPILDRADDLLRGIEEFRQHTGGLPLFPAPLGKASDVESVDADKMKEIILELRKTCGEVAKIEAENAARA